MLLVFFDVATTKLTYSIQIKNQINLSKAFKESGMLMGRAIVAALFVMIVFFLVQFALRTLIELETIFTLSLAVTPFGLILIALAKIIFFVIMVVLIGLTIARVWFAPTIVAIEQDGVVDATSKSLAVTGRFKIKDYLLTAFVILVFNIWMYLPNMIAAYAQFAVVRTSEHYLQVLATTVIANVASMLWLSISLVVTSVLRTLWFIQLREA